MVTFCHMLISNRALWMMHPFTSSRRCLGKTQNWLLFSFSSLRLNNFLSLRHYSSSACLFGEFSISSVACVQWLPLDPLDCRHVSWHVQWKLPFDTSSSLLFLNYYFIMDPLSSSLAFSFIRLCYFIKKYHRCPFISPILGALLEFRRMPFEGVNGPF